MTLTELSFYSRKMLPVAIISFLLLMIFVYTIQILLFVGTPRGGSASIPLNTVFGSIKAPQIKDATPSGEFKYTLDTIEGEPITATTAAEVYFLPPTTTKFGFREKMYVMAKALGFDTEIIKHELVNETDALFNDERQKLTIDITNFNFNYQYDLRGDEPYFSTIEMPETNDQIENRAVDFLKSLGRYPEELSKGKRNVVYLNYNPANKQMAIVQRLADANMAEVDFYRPDQNTFPVITPSYFNSQNYVVILFHKDGFKIVRAQVKFFEKSEEQIGVYPIKSGEAAWKDFNEGKGIVLVPPTSEDKVLIKKMYMGYYDTDVYQEYLEPVYVFLGDNNFVGFVPAVDDKYILTKEDTL